MTTKPVSRNGTASTTSGTTSAIRALVFSEPSMITAPSSRPSRLEPQSPMKTDAGWKLCIRKPSAAPAVIAASTPAASRPRSKAMIEKATALMAQTPAASPSTPSEKLTTLITATMPITVSGPPKSPNSSAPRNGKVMFSTTTPALTRTSAATTWPASLIHGGSSRMSSSAPTMVISAAATRIPRVRSLSGMKTSAAISTPAKMARPPSSGVASLASPRSFISLTAPIRRQARHHRRQDGGGGERDEGGMSASDSIR